MTDTNETGTKRWAEKGIYLLLGFMLVATIAFTIHGIREVLSPHGATDLHAYWYSGHFVRQGTDPYQAYFDGQLPALPVHYVDGVIDRDGPVVQPGLAITPAYTPFMIVLFSGSSFFSWPTAKLLWMLFNMVLVLLIPWLVIKLLPEDANLSNIVKLFLLLAFFCLQGTRISIWTGQASLLVFALMLLALLTMNKNALIPGLFLGIALGKYSLAIGLVLFLFYKRRYLIIGLAFAWQLIGLLLLSLFVQVSPLAIIENNVRLLLHYTDFPGVHLASLFPNVPVLSVTAVLILTLGTGWVLFRQYRMAKQEKQPLFDLYVLTILTLWSLLVAYHRAYDTILIILFIALTLYELTHDRLGQLQKKKDIVFLGIFIVTLSIPSSIMALVFPAAVMPAWYRLVSVAMTLALLSALLITSWRFRLFSRL